MIGPHSSGKQRDWSTLSFVRFRFGDVFGHKEVAPSRGRALEVLCNIAWRDWEGFVSLGARLFS